MQDDDEFHRHPNWLTATLIAQQILPGSTGVELDSLAGLGPESWEEFHFEEFAPEEASRLMLERFTPFLSGLLVLISDASYRDGVGPFLVHTNSLSAFLDRYPSLYDEPFVSTDVVILCPRTGYVGAVHHNGLIALVKGAAASLP